jgi:hypothetical protein
VSDAFTDLGYDPVGTPRLPCPNCKGSGEVLAYLVQDGSPFSFKCSCPAGELCDKKKWPLWPGTGAGYSLTRNSERQELRDTTATVGTARDPSRSTIPTQT